MYDLYIKCKSWITECEEAIESNKLSVIELEELRDRGKQIPVKTDEMLLLELYLTHKRYKEKINKYYKEKHTYTEYLDLVKEGQSLKTSIIINKKRRQIITKEYKDLKNILVSSEKWVVTVDKYINNNKNKLDFNRLVELYNEGKEYPNLVYDKLEMLKSPIEKCLLFLNELYEIYPHFKPTEPYIIFNNNEEEKEEESNEICDDINDLPDIITSEPPSSNTPMISPLTSPLVSPINSGHNSGNNSGKKSPKYTPTPSPTTPTRNTLRGNTPKLKTPKSISGNRNLRSNNNNIKKEKIINRKVVNTPNTKQQKGKKNVPEFDEMNIKVLPNIKDVENIIQKYLELNIIIPEADRVVEYKTEYDNWIKEYERVFIQYNNETENEENENEKTKQLLELIDKNNVNNISLPLKSFLEQCKSLTVLVSKNSEMSNHTLRLLYEKSKNLKISTKNERKYIRDIFKTYAKAKGIVTNYLSNYINYMYEEILKLYPLEYQEVIDRKVKESKVLEMEKIRQEEIIEYERIKALARGKNRMNRKRNNLSGNNNNYNSGNISGNISGRGGPSANRLSSYYIQNNNNNNERRKTRNFKRGVYNDDYDDNKYTVIDDDYLIEDYSDIINDKTDNEEEEEEEDDVKMEEEEEIEDKENEEKDKSNNEEMEIENNEETVETVETLKTIDDLPLLSYDKIIEIMKKEKELIEEFMRELIILDEIKNEIKYLSTSDKRIKSVKIVYI